MANLIRPVPFEEPVLSAAMFEIRLSSGCQERKCTVAISEDVSDRILLFQHGVHTLAIPKIEIAYAPAFAIRDRVREWARLIHFEEDRPLGD